jgi:hypothetical protein
MAVEAQAKVSSARVVAAREIDTAITVRDAFVKLDEYRGLWDVDTFLAIRDLLMHREIERTRAATALVARQRDRASRRAKSDATK